VSAATKAKPETNGAEPKSEAPEHTTLAEALLAAQIDMPAVEPDKGNPAFKGSKYVSLGILLAKVRPVLNRHSLVLVQMPTLAEDGKFVLATRITHAPSGQSLEFDSPLKPTKDDPQGQGSAITYMRRYSLAAALAIADQEDDDGNAASGSAPTAQARRREGQGDGQSSQATAAQRRKIHARASELGLSATQLKAWIEWNAGTPLTDRIEKTAASKLIELLEGYEDATDALAAFSAALEAEDERAQAIAGKHREDGEAEGAS
jgi:hypothetical protein